MTIQTPVHTRVHKNDSLAALARCIMNLRLKVKLPLYREAWALCIQSPRVLRVTVREMPGDGKLLRLVGCEDKTQVVAYVFQEPDSQVPQPCTKWPFRHIGARCQEAYTQSTNHHNWKSERGMRTSLRRSGAGVEGSLYRASCHGASSRGFWPSRSNDALHEFRLSANMSHAL